MLAAIYLRLSRDEEQKGLSEVLHNHREALIKLARQNNLKFEIYQEVSSGMNSERPELTKLINRIEEYDYILCMDLDRLTRDNIHAEQLKQIFILNDISIVTPSGEIDFTNESNELLYSFSSLLANYEWKQIRKRMSRGRLAAASEGKWVGSNKVPLGYSKDENKRLVINEDEAMIVRFIFEKIIEGYSANQIAKELDLMGWRTREGKVITTSHIAIFRKNPVYYGCVSMKRRVNGKVVDEVFVEDAHEPIVTKQQFLLVQNIIEQRSKEFKFRQKGSITRKLQGLIYCNKCGRKRYIQMDGSGVDFIKSCSYKVDNNKCSDKGMKYLPIEQAVIEDVKQLKAGIEKELEQLKSTDIDSVENKLREQKSSLERNLNRITNRRKTLSLMRADGELSKQEFEELRTETDSQIQQLQQQIDLLDIQLQNLSNTENEQKRLEFIIGHIERIDELTLEEVNSFLKSIIKKIKFSSNNESNHNTRLEKADPTVEIEYL